MSTAGFGVRLRMARARKKHKLELGKELYLIQYRPRQTHKMLPTEERRQLSELVLTAEGRRAGSITSRVHPG